LSRISYNMSELCGVSNLTEFQGYPQPHLKLWITPQLCGQIKGNRAGK